MGGSLSAWGNLSMQVGGSGHAGRKRPHRPEQEDNNQTGFKHVLLKNGPNQGPNLALTVLFVPRSPKNDPPTPSDKGNSDKGSKPIV